MKNNSGGGPKISTPGLLPDANGNIDFKGDYIVNEQTTTNMMSKGTVYRFDGVDDKIVVTDDATIQNIFDGGGFVAAKVYPLSSGTTGRIFDKNEHVIFLSADDGTNASIRVFQGFSGTDGYWTTGSVLPLGKQSDILVVYDNSSVSNNPTLYIDGIPEDLTEGSTPVGTRNTDAGSNLGLGCAVSLDRTFDGEIGEVMLGNFAPTAAEVKDLISGNIPFKWQYGSQTLNLDVDDFSADGTWAGGTSATIGTTLTLAGGGTGQAFAINTAGDVSPAGIGGKIYRVAYTIDSNSLIGTGTIRVGGNFVSSGDMLEATTLTDLTIGTHSIDAFSFGSGNMNRMGIIMSDGFTSGSIVISLIQTWQLGAVALYDQTSISETYWYDKANGNDGAVTGAEVLNPPSVTPLLATHTNAFSFAPGATPGTNINCTGETTGLWNPMAVTDTTNLAKSGSDGSFSLSANGATITISLGKNVVGVRGYGLRRHDLNSSSTSELYFPTCREVSGNITFILVKRGATSATDLTTILDLGDSCVVWIDYVTST